MDKIVNLCKNRGIIFPGSEIYGGMGNTWDYGPVGVEFKDRKVPADIPSATQWTSATDVKNRIIYYRTMYNSSVRSIDLASIDFAKVRYRAEPLDKVAMEPITAIKIR